MLHKRINADSRTIGSIHSVPSKKISLEEKMKIIIEYFQNHDEDLAPIPEELDKQESNQIENTESAMNPNSHTEPEDKIEDFSDLQGNQTSNCGVNKIANNFPVRDSVRMEYILDKSLTLKILDCTKRKLNPTIPSKSLYRTVSLSSLLDLPTNHSSDIRKCLSVSNLNQINNRKNSSLASTNVDVNLWVLNNSISLCKLSSNNLTQSQSYFSCSKFLTGSSSFLNTIQKSQTTNPLIVRTKQKIKYFENKNCNSLGLSSLINHRIFQDYSSNFQFSPKLTIKTNEKNPKVFNHKFKLHHFANRNLSN